LRGRDKRLARLFNLDDQLAIVGAAYHEIGKAKPEEIGLWPDLDRHGVKELRVLRKEALERPS
jgi:hypothetical protein